jgi:hypothetical protein
MKIEGEVKDGLFIFTVYAEDSKSWVAGSDVPTAQDQGLPYAEWFERIGSPTLACCLGALDGHAAAWAETP